MDRLVIDPLTGRPMLRGPGGYALGEDFTSPVGATTADRMRAAAAQQARQREAAQAAAPASPRQFLGEGDGAPMFDPTIVPQPPPPPGEMLPQDPTPYSTGVLAPRPAPGGPPQEPEPFSSGIAPPPPPLPTPPQMVAPPPPQAAPRQPQGALAGPLMAPPVNPPMGDDDVSLFEQRLLPAESGGRADAVNREGFSGLHQFGSERLATLGVYRPGEGEGRNGWRGQFNIPGFENVRTHADFLANPDAQRAVFRAHIADIDATIDSLPGAEAFNRNGLRAVAHLGGSGGMRRFVESGGRYNPADSNGTSLGDYYRRFSGSDAPPGSSGMQGRDASAAQAAAPGMQSVSDRPPPLEPTGVPGEAPAPGGDFLSRNGNALMAAGAGMMSGRNFMDGFGRAGAAFVGQANQNRSFEQGARDRASARADRQALLAEGRSARQQSAAELAAYRRAQLAQGQARIDRRGASESAAGSTVQASTRLRDPETDTTYVLDVGRDRSRRVTTLSGEPVTDPAILGRLREGNEPGAAAEGRDLIEQRNAAFETTRGARTLRPSLAAARRVLQEDPNLTGPDVATRVMNTVVEALGVPIGQRTPENLAMIQQAFQQGRLQNLLQIAPSLRPMSNVDLQAVDRLSPSVVTNPRTIGAWLDQMDQAAERAERMGADLAKVLETREGARALQRSGGVSAWRERWEATEAATRRPNGQVQSPVQPGVNPQGQREWQTGERRQGPAGITVERID